MGGDLEISKGIFLQLVVFGVLGQLLNLAEKGDGTQTHKRAWEALWV